MSARIPFVSSPVGTFYAASLLGGIFLLVGGLMMIGPKNTAPFAAMLGLAGYLGATIWAGYRLSVDFPHASLGLCNIATLGRLVLVGILLIALLGGVTPNWMTFALAVIALSLDGVDGWLARKQGLASDFGARFDVEVDAAFALLLAVSAAVAGAAEPSVVLLGLPYYLFVAASVAFPWLAQPLPDRFSRKAVCVLQIAALIVLQVPIIAPGQLGLLILAVTAGLIWSFGHDIVWLWRRAK